MLDFVLTQSPLRFGLAEGVDPHHAPFGSLSTAENVVWRKSGRAEKRYGTRKLPRTISVIGTPITAAARLVVRDRELALVDYEKLYSWSPALNAWRDMGRVPNIGLTWSTILDSADSVDATDIALSSGGLLVHAWTTVGSSSSAGGRLRVQVIDRATGQVVMSPTRLGTLTNCRGVRVIIDGTTAIIITHASPNIVAFTVDLTTLFTGASANLRTDAVGNAFDAIQVGSLFVICYVSTGPVIRLASFDTALVQQTSGTITGETLGAESLGIERAAGVIAVAYSRNNAGTRDVRFAASDETTLVQSTAPVTLESDAGIAWALAVRSIGANFLALAFTRNVAGGVPIDSTIRTTTYRITTTGSFTTQSRRTTYGAALRCRPFMMGNLCYALVSDAAMAILGTVQSPQSYESYLVEVDTNVVTLPPNHQPHPYVGKVDHLIAGFPSEFTPSNAAVVSSTELVLPSVFYAELPRRLTSNFRQGIRLVSITRTTSLPRDHWRTVAYGGEAYSAGSVLTGYDGRRVFDYVFARPPWFHSLTPAAAGGSMAGGATPSTGNYLYGAHCEWISAAGVKHRSATVNTPVPVNIQLAAGVTTGQVTLVFGGVNVGMRLSMPNASGESPVVPVLLAIYRSTMDGLNYHRLTYEPLFNVLLVDQSAPLQTFVDTRNDSAIDANAVALSVRPVIYTSGGILDDEQPPAATTIALHKQRLWMVDGTQRQIWFSKSFLDDAGTAPGFSTDLRILVEANVTAMATMDDRLIVFARDEIWYLLGDGPAPNGQNSNLEGPIRIQSDVGCIDPRSVVETPDGVMFQSSRGLYLLTRGLELAWIGRDVKDVLEAYPRITSAVLVPRHNQVRITANNVAGSEGVVLVYDYVEKQWATSRYYDATFEVASTPIADAVVWNDAWTFVTPTGTVYIEDETTRLDDGTQWVPMTIETTWNSAAGPLGFISARKFSIRGASLGNHNLTISCGFDSDPSYPQTRTFAGGSSVTSIGPLEDCEITIGTRRKCRAIRFKIQDAPPTDSVTYPVGIGAGPRFDTFAIELGVKKGLAGVAAKKKG